MNVRRVELPACDEHTPDMKKLSLLLCTLVLHLQSFAEDGYLQGGWVRDDRRNFEIYAGAGEVTSLSGSVVELQGGGLISGGLNADLSSLGVDEGSGSTFFGGAFMGKWLTLRVDVRNNSIESSGTATADFRINVDGVPVPGGGSLEYLVIPVGSDFTLDADSNWIGTGLRFTPFTLNASGRVRFTPWLHLGVQYVDTSFTIDSGDSVTIEAPGFGGRTFAVNGEATGDAQLLIPEYGFGGEVRFRFHEEGERGIQLVASGTFKVLQFDGTLSSIGFEADEFDDLSIDYTALDMGLELLYPIGDSMFIKGGLFYEQVDGNVELDSKPSAGNFTRELDGDYTLTGFRVGVQF